jgi:hypothetical protein
MNAHDIGQLSAPEKALWSGFPRGTQLDLSMGEPDADDPGCGHSWGDTRVIRAEVITALLLGVQPGEAGYNPVIWLRGARIVGQLSLPFADVHTTMLLENCYFEQRPDLYFASLGFTSLRGSVIPGLLASNLRVNGHLRLSGCSLDGEVTLRGAKIAGGLLLDGARMQGPAGRSLDGERLKVAGDVNMNQGFVSEGELRLFNAQIGGTLNLVEAQVSAPGGQALSADNIHTDGSIYAHRADITGQVLLRHATLNGGLFLEGAHLSNPDGPALLGARLDAEEGLFLDRLRCKGEIRLNNARIGRNLILSAAELNNDGGEAITARGTIVQGSVNAKHLKTRGTVSLTDAHVNGPIHFEHARLENSGGTALDASGIQASASIDISDGFTANGAVNLINARITSYLSLEGAVLLCPDGEALQAWRADMPELVLRPRHVEGTVNLQHAKINILRDDMNNWPGKLQLDGLTYNILEPQLPARERLAWLALDPGGHLASPYEQLAAVYRTHGRDADARTVQLAKQRRGRSALAWYMRFWGHLQDITVGYGYRPTRAALWLVTLLAIGTAVFSVHPPAPFPNASVPPFNPFIYTLNLILPIIDFGQEHAFDPRGFEQWLSYALILAGWTLATTAATGVIRLLRRD